MAQEDIIKLFQTTYYKSNGSLRQRPNHEPIEVSQTEDLDNVNLSTAIARYTPDVLKLFPPYKTMSILRKHDQYLTRSLFYKFPLPDDLNEYQMQT